LIEIGRDDELIEHDRYYLAAAAANPLRVELEDGMPVGCIRALWSTDGRIESLPGINQEWELSQASGRATSSVNRLNLSAGGALAATFRQGDEWVSEVRRDRAGEPIFVARMGEYWLVPWKHNAKMMGLWLLDLAYWNVSRQDHCSPPSLIQTTEILNALAPLAPGYLINGAG
jgi:hypothetical protein